MPSFIELDDPEMNRFACFGETASDQELGNEE
jgi:hypothetical protein